MKNDQCTDYIDMSIDIMSEIGPFLGGGLLCIINNNLNCREICQRNMYWGRQTVVMLFHYLFSFFMLRSSLLSISEVIRGFILDS